MPIILTAALLTCAVILLTHPWDPNPLWKLPTGETIEILTYKNWYEASYSVMTKRVEGQHYLWLQFRSALTDRDEDRRLVLAVARVLCPRADSVGVHRLKIEPTRTRFFGLVTYSHPYWFEVDSSECRESMRG